MCFVPSVVQPVQTAYPIHNNYPVSYPEYIGETHTKGAKGLFKGGKDKGKLHAL